MKRTQSILISSVLVTALLAFSFGWFFAKNISTAEKKLLQATIGTSSDAREKNLRIRDVDEVWKRLQDGYYDISKLDLSKLEWNAVKGFVAGVGDPYTVFMNPDESKDFENGLEGQLEGIGAELEVKEGKLIVVSPLKKSPAEEAGIRSGDIIYKIDGALAEEMTFYNAIQKIRGKKGTSVTLTIIRENTPQPLEMRITRREITIESVVLEKLDGDIYHLSILQFNDHTKDEFNNAIQKILLEKTKGLILDLRGNGGGYLDIAVDIASEFIVGKKPVVIVKQRNASKNKTIPSNGSGRLADISLVVLVDKGSASASEIVAGAVQDYKRGVLIGEKTFGKGSVQELSRLDDGSNLRMTIAKWFTPLDRSIDEVGIAPDKEVKITDEDRLTDKDTQLEAAVNYFK